MGFADPTKVAEHILVLMLLALVLLLLFIIKLVFFAEYKYAGHWDFSLRRPINLIYGKFDETISPAISHLSEGEKFNNIREAIEHIQNGIGDTRKISLYRSLL